MEPRLIEFPVHKDPTGNLAVADYDDLPFEVKRVFWIYDMEGHRGNHALKTCHQLIIPISGIMYVDTVYKQTGAIKCFPLRKKNVGLYLPPMVWRLIFTGTACLVLASHPFDEDDYIDGIDDFMKALATQEMEKGLKFADEVS